MNTATISGSSATEALLARISAHSVGILALWLVLAGIALANTTLALQHALLSGPSWGDTGASLALAGLGMVLIWRGLGLEDPQASICGYAGGALLWMGFFEWTWVNFALWLGVDPLIIDGQAVLPPSLLLVQASTFIFLPLVVLTAANKDTRCRMMLWLRRQLHLETPTPSAGHTHNASRVSATETVFIIWFIYLLNIALYDPRLLGSSLELYTASAGVIGLWACYLLVKLLRIKNPGLAVRYAIPTAYLFSIPIDGITQTGWFPAFWIQPLSYPISAFVVVIVFTVCALALGRAAASSTS